MKVTFQQTEKLLKGNQKFSVFGFSMMMTLLKQNYAKDSSQATVESCTEAINTFLGKYHAIMSADYAIIEGL